MFGLQENPEGMCFCVSNDRVHIQRDEKEVVEALGWFHPAACDRTATITKKCPCLGAIETFSETLHR